MQQMEVDGLTPFEELYLKAVDAFLNDKGERDLAQEAAAQPHELACLLHPEKHAVICRLSDCLCGGEDCEKSCLFNAIKRDGGGNVVVSEKDCTGCGACIEVCKQNNLSGCRDILPVLEQLHTVKEPVYAMIAPAFTSQFGGEVGPGRLRTAFKKLGFTGMIEVALFADILTLKEALEFDRLVQTEQDFLLTSCCCPIWISMIKKVYGQLAPHIPPSVSPMVACGRSIKKLYPKAKTVFIGPCLAKKAEAREADIADAVDYVLTFKEIADVFKLANIKPAECEEDMRDHSSTAGRIYARSGGVSSAVQSTLERLVPGRGIPLKAMQADGVPACKALLKDVQEGIVSANFIEGMGCAGGCVGGPRVLIPREEGAAYVDGYGEAAAYKTPVDNPYVIELLARLGFESLPALLKVENMFTRKF